MPRGRETSWSAGHSSSGTFQGRSSSAGSLGAASSCRAMEPMVPGAAPQPLGRPSGGEALAAGGGEQVDVARLRSEVDRLALLRRLAAVDARDHVVGLAVDVGRAVDVGVRAELLDEVDRGLQALALADQGHVLRT